MMTQQQKKRKHEGEFADSSYSAPKRHKTNVKGAVNLLFSAAAAVFSFLIKTKSLLVEPLHHKVWVLKEYGVKESWMPLVNIKDPGIRISIPKYRFANGEVLFWSVNDSTIAERVGNVIPRIFNWKVIGIKVKYEKFMTGMFSMFVYTNLRSTHEEVQRLDLPTIDGIELNNDESTLSHDTYPDHSGKRHAVDIYTQSDMDHQGFEDFSTVPSLEILIKAGLSTHASASQPTKKRRTVRFDTTTVPMQHSEKTPPSLSKKKDSSDQKWNELKFFLQSYDDELGGFTTGGVSSIDNFEEMDIVTSLKDKGKKDFEGFSSDVGTSTLYAHVEEIVNQEMKDIGTATLNALVDAVVNQNSNYSKVQNPENIHEDHSDEYLSTLSESAQLEIDAIMQGLAAPVDDVPLEVVKSVDETVNLHSLSDSQISSNYPDSVVAAHLAALEDESTEFKQTFAFEGYEIYDDKLSSIIKEYKKWVLEGLLKFHSKKKMNDEHYKAKASSLGVQQYDFVVAHAHSKKFFYFISQKNSCWNDEHIDVIFYHLRKKSKLWTDQEYRFTTTNYFFKNYVEKTYRSYYPNDSDTILSTQKDYAESVVMANNENAVNNIIKEFSILALLPWHLVDEVYVPMNCNQNLHWVLAVITLKDRRIRVYDSLSNIRNMDSSVEIQKLAVMLPTFLSDCEFFEQIFRTDWPNLDAYRDKLSDTTQLLNTNSFEVEYVQNISQQDCDSLDCGVFIAGYEEYISEGMSVPSVGFEVSYHPMRYISLLRNFDLRKAKKDYVSENEDSPRPRRTKHSIPDEMDIVRIR
ncbi:hypothetical protein T459_29360 [Capsicum annuum]|uniref:Ubiquitin-like protease family profile domain-containing protein n=1 Tax=Capsicum annuum TaxID=4072 RepID=A0A2G2Y5B1_CAPAN|nr:hypothetical protein T459_29360 [Capsicum annuum]